MLGPMRRTLQTHQRYWLGAHSDQMVMLLGLQRLMNQIHQSWLELHQTDYSPVRQHQTHQSLSQQQRRILRRMD